MLPIACGVVAGTCSVRSLLKCKKVLSEAQKKLYKDRAYVTAANHCILFKL